MITVCKQHVKESINLLNVPHIQRLSKTHEEQKCTFCGEQAHFKLFYSTPIENTLFKIKMKSSVS
ncbi:hypothetical protein CN918_00780 [Priestia megaterium]|nr:hypothetical protein ASG61_19165 [Bacillus sp. Leaf75]PET69448.1 hypothetical protein CN533_22905 [Priestia megaterium]PFI58889.1 hypothetical protein COI68_27640 [Priestia megaterium]PFK81847.1 hypothetical protein COJ19_27080 [Priestia megaterium]PGK60235.1 hypothetical protein CN918_00780 [Priestia megaterium]